MKRTSIQTLALLAAAALGTATAQADVLYDSTLAPRFDPPNFTNPLGYNNNGAFVGNETHIQWDDAAIFVNGVAGSYVNVTRLTFGIFRDVGAPAVNLDIYWSDMVPDNGLNRGTNVIPLDSPINDPGSANFIGTIPLTANPGAQVQLLVSIGNGVDTLFTTGILDQSTPDVDPTSDLNDPDYILGLHPGYGFFFAGLKFSDVTPLSGIDPKNNWILASHPHNLFYTVDDFQDANPSTIDEFWLGPDSTDVPIKGTMSLKVEGSVVPEPASLGMLGVTAAGLLTRRRRSA